MNLALSELIRRAVTRDMQKAFHEAGIIFQLDLAPCYSSKQVKKVFMKLR